MVDYGNVLYAHAAITTLKSHFSATGFITHFVYFTGT